MVTTSGGSGGAAPKRRGNPLAAIGDGNPAFSIDMSRAAPVNSPRMAYRSPGNADNGSALAGMVNGSGDLNNQAAMAALQRHNNAGPKQSNPLLGLFGAIGSGINSFVNDPIQSPQASDGHFNTGTRNSAAARGLQNIGFGIPAANQPPKYGGTGSGQGTGTASMLQAFAQHQPGTFDSGGGSSGQPDPQPQLASFQMPAMPQLESVGDYNSFLSQVMAGMHLDQLDKSYQNNIDLIGSDTNRSVDYINQASNNAQGDIRQGTGLLQQSGQQNDANGAALEAALSAQQAATAQGSGASNNALAQTLGTGTAVGGNDNSSLAAQNAAAQQYLAASAQNNQAANDATTQAQVADNQNYGKVVDAKATSDSQNAQAAGRDAQSQVGLQRSQADLAARTSGSAQAAGMLSAAQQNAVARYNAQVQAALGIGGLQQAEQTIGLNKYTAENNVAYQNNSLAAQVAGAKASNLQNAYAPLFAQIANADKYSQVNSPLTGQGIGSAEQLAQAMLQAYGQDQYTPTISQGLLNGSQDSGIAPTLQDVLSYNGQTTKKKR